MPVEFLTSEQRAQYGQFVGEPSPEQLAKYFLFDDHDLELILLHRGRHNRLGFAIQLGTVRFLGTFITNIASMPVSVCHYVAKQLKIDLVIDELIDYSLGERRLIHTAEICKLFGYTRFTDQPAHLRLIRWLYTCAWLTAERSSILFDLTTARLTEHRVLLPGATVLERLVSRVRDRANLRLWKKLSLFPNEDQRKQLEQLLEVDSKRRQSKLDMLRQPPTNPTAIGLTKAIERLESIRMLGALEWNTSSIPAGRIRILARYASMAKAQSIARMTDDRRIAALVAFAIIFTRTAQDDVLCVMEQVFANLFKTAAHNDQKTRIRTIKDLDAAARKLGEACSVLLDDNVSETELRLQGIFRLKRP